jgi:TonB-linked SusC/RagA family outer membrane protein
MDVILQNPTVTRHSLNVTGGNERVRYFLGGSYYYESGLFKNTDYNRYNLRGSIDTNITKNLIASLNMNIDMRYDSKPFWKNDAGGDSLFDLFGLALLYSPSMYPAYINGLPVGNNMSGHVPELVDKMGYYHRRYSNYEANIALQYNVPFIEGLSLKVSYNNYSRHQFIKEFNRPYTLYEFKMTGSHYHIMTDEPTGNIISISGYGDWLNEKYISDRNYQLNGIINYDRRIGLHEINARVIYEQAEGFNDEFRAQTQYFISNAIDQLFAGSRDPKDFSIEGKGSETARMSYAGWFHYGYADRYMLEFSLRYDASLIFAPERRWGLFPSVSGAWRVSQEEFFKNNVKFISNLKLRGSVALLGNDAIGGWQWMNRYAFDNGALYGNITKGIKPGTVPNPFVTWEKSLSYDGGLEAGFLNNRLTMEFGAFYKHTYDILGSRTNILPSTFGGDMPSENYGVMDTRGFEAELGYTDMIGKDFTYRISGNMGYAVNKYIIKDEAENLPAYRSRIGQPTDRMRGYIYTDIIRTQADLDALPEGYTINGVAPRLGLLNYKDVRGVTSDEPDGKITDEDRDWIAEHTTPPLNYGFSVGASWKGIALDFFFQGVAGNYVLINERQVDARVARKNFSFWNDHYTPENINAAFPLVYTQGSSSYPISSFWIRNGAYLRLKNLNLSYTLPKSVLSKLGLGSLQVFFTGTNLWIIKDYVKYFDPEFSEDTYSYDDENDSGKHHNIKRYPIMRSFSLGINLSF